MKHCIAPSLFTQSDLQFDPLAIFGLATAPCAARTSTIVASGAITVPERLMLRLPAFENPSLECTPVRASGPGSVTSSDHSRLAFPCATKTVSGQERTRRDHLAQVRFTPQSGHFDPLVE